MNFPSSLLIEVAEKEFGVEGTHVQSSDGLACYQVRMGQGPDWGETRRYVIGGEGGQVRLSHYLFTSSSLQIAVAEVSSGDHLCYRASWLPNRTRRLSPTKLT